MGSFDQFSCFLKILLAFLVWHWYFELNKIDVLVSQTRITSVNLVRDGRFSNVFLNRWILTKISLVHASTILSSARKLQISLTSLTKNIYFATNPRAFRGVWDLDHKVFDKVNPILPGAKSFGWFFESYFEKRWKWIIQNGTRTIWILLTVSFSMVFSELS